MAREIRPEPEPRQRPWAWWLLTALVAIGCSAFAFLQQPPDDADHPPAGWRALLQPLERNAWLRVQRGEAPPGGAELVAVQAGPDGDTAWVGVSDGSVLRTTDGGRAWRSARLELPPGASLALLRMAAGGRGWALDSAGALHTTRDGGATWAPEPVGAEPRIRGLAVSPDRRRAVALGESGVWEWQAGKSWRRVGDAPAMRYGAPFEQGQALKEVRRAGDAPAMPSGKAPAPERPVPLAVTDEGAHAIAGRAEVWIRSAEGTASVPLDPGVHPRALHLGPGGKRLLLACGTAPCAPSRPAPSRCGTGTRTARSSISRCSTASAAGRWAPTATSSPRATAPAGWRRRGRPAPPSPPSPSPRAAGAAGRSPARPSTPPPPPAPAPSGTPATAARPGTDSSSSPSACAPSGAPRRHRPGGDAGGRLDEVRRWRAHLGGGRPEARPRLHPGAGPGRRAAPALRRPRLPPPRPGGRAGLGGGRSRKAPLHPRRRQALGAAGAGRARAHRHRGRHAPGPPLLRRHRRRPPLQRRGRRRLGAGALQLVAGALVLREPGGGGAARAPQPARPRAGQARERGGPARHRQAHREHHRRRARRPRAGPGRLTLHPQRPDPALAHPGRHRRVGQRQVLAAQPAPGGFAPLRLQPGVVQRLAPRAGGEPDRRPLRADHLPGHPASAVLGGAGLPLAPAAPQDPRPERRLPRLGAAAHHRRRLLPRPAGAPHRPDPARPEHRGGGVLLPLLLRRAEAPGGAVRPLRRGAPADAGRRLEGPPGGAAPAATGRRPRRHQSALAVAGRAQHPARPDWNRALGAAAAQGVRGRSSALRRLAGGQRPGARPPRERGLPRALRHRLRGRDAGVGAPADGHPGGRPGPLLAAEHAQDAGGPQLPRHLGRVLRGDGHLRPGGGGVPGRPVPRAGRVPPPPPAPAPRTSGSSPTRASTWRS